MDKYILKVWRGLRNEITFILSPTEKWGTKTEYTKLKKFLHKDGYLRIAPEVYMRIVQNRKGNKESFFSEFPLPCIAVECPSQNGVSSTFMNRIMKTINKSNLSGKYIR